MIERATTQQSVIRNSSATGATQSYYAYTGRYPAIANANEQYFAKALSVRKDL